MQGWINMHKSINRRQNKQKERQKSQDLIPRWGKAFDKAQHPLMIKTLSKVGVEGP